MGGGERVWGYGGAVKWSTMENARYGKPLGILGMKTEENT